MPSKLIRVALLALLVFAIQGTWALAGTTGTLSGYATLQDGSPLAGAKVTAASPSASETATTDAGGHFVFVSLTPDTYTVTVTKDGYDTVSQSGVTVIADNTQTVTLRTQKQAAVLAVIPVRAANELVKPGTTADVYSVNSAQSAKLSLLGGGGGADNVYGAIASLPGAYVPPGQFGWYQTVHIRGGDYDQVGYEYDGVPVNRSFDNYPSSTASNVGQSELQVYTGAAPQNAEGQGLSGFINQVIKDGTYPGFATLDLAIGSPSMYNRANFEIGGATPSRNFTYYVATGGYNVRPRLVDNSNGASLTPLWGTAYDYYGSGSNYCTTQTNADSCAANYSNSLFFGVGPGGPGGYILGPYVYGFTSQVADRENVVNLHFGLPHRNDSGKDDIQFLYSNSLLRNPYQEGPLDWGLGLISSSNPVTGQGFGFTGGFGPSPTVNYPSYFSGVQNNTPLGTTFVSGCAAPCGVIPYSYPSSNTQPCNYIAGTCTPLASGQQDSSENGQGIFKLQYQHNIGSNAYLRVYGYSYYSWWYLYGPNSLNNAFVGCCPSDYELTTHTRGASAEFADQINARNLITAQISAIKASTVRDNNLQMLSAFGSRGRQIVLVNANNPYNGICYQASGAFGSCEPGAPGGVRAAFLSGLGTMSSGIPAAPAVCGGQCAWMEAENGVFATYNNVKPLFYSASLGDQWHPSDKLQFNLGVRLDSFQFTGGNTDTGNARTFWFNAFNNEYCSSPVPGSQAFNKFVPTNQGGLGGTSALTPCSAFVDPLTGSPDLTPANLVNASAQKFTYTVFQPRFGGTFTMDPDNVIRFSIGEYDQAPNAAFEQYNTLQQNLPAFIGPTFLKYGLNTPGHQLQPSTSWNSDVSWEHRFANSDVSFKLSPFYRSTRNQYQQLYLDQKTSFVSGLPVGKQTSEGVELQLQKGDFSRNGLSGLLSYTYTWSYINYQALPGNGGTVLSPINNAIKQYNGYTSFCAANPSDSRCGLTTALTTAAPCYTASGAPDPVCAPGSVANPYWNAPVQNLFDPGAKYLPFDIFPGAFNASVSSYAVPNVGTLILNWKHDKLSLTPSVQYFGEGFYGSPLQSPGIDPAAGCGTPLSSGFTGDSRYPFGPPAVGTGGSPYNAPGCSGNILIPNPYTGHFDALGAFRTPQQLLGSIQISYEATPRVTYVAGFTNLVNTCWGGSKQAWTALSDHRVCGYGLPGYAPLPSAGNFYNPDSVFQTQVKYPYMQTFGVAPVQAAFEVRVKL